MDNMFIYMHMLQSHNKATNVTRKKSNVTNFSQNQGYQTL